MSKFPVDAPIRKVMVTLERLGFRLVREGSHISMLRENPDGTKTPLTIPNHSTIKKSTLRTILTQSGISREAFLKAYEEYAPVSGKESP
jgi:predicted RNA binding protein YcfA (HicA-like mRNA interferase family)